ncbi:hypothetical protein I4U23_025907 [Adineta vaga]|nr:hypothetical protein I4U23_025907 [Adineta vaga]
MICNITCLNDGICSFNDTCLCPPCYIGTSCDISVNVIKFSLTYAMYYDSQNNGINSYFNSITFSYTIIIALMLLISILNNLACLQTFFLHDIRSTNCGIFQILYCLTGLITLIGMQLRMLTMLEFDRLTQAYSYRYIACNIIPVLIIATGDTCMWLSALLAIEFVLLERFNWNLYRTRRFSVISSLICLIIIASSHLHEIIARRPLPDVQDPSAYSCTFIYPLPIDIFDKILRTSHIIIPCMIHFFTSLCIFSSMTRRILLLYSREDYFQVFITECIRRKHFFIPPFVIILFNLPHLILHLKDACEDARDTFLLRMHISFNIFVYFPSTITFFIYIYPSKSYMHQFKKTFIGHWFKRIFHLENQKKIRKRMISNDSSV